MKIICSVIRGHASALSGLVSEFPKQSPSSQKHYSTYHVAQFKKILKALNDILTL